MTTNEHRRRFFPKPDPWTRRSSISSQLVIFCQLRLGLGAETNSTITELLDHALLFSLF